MIATPCQAQLVERFGKIRVLGGSIACSLIEQEGSSASNRRCAWLSLRAGPASIWLSCTDTRSPQSTNPALRMRSVLGIQQTHQSPVRCGLLLLSLCAYPISACGHAFSFAPFIPDPPSLLKILSFLLLLLLAPHPSSSTRPFPSPTPSLSVSVPWGLLLPSFPPFLDPVALAAELIA